MTSSAPAVSEHPFYQHPFRHADCIVQSCAEAQFVLNIGRVLTVDDQADVSFLRSRGNGKHYR